MQSNHTATIIGQQIRKARQSAKLSQKDAARRASISPSYFNMIENGQRQVAGQLLQTISDVLGVEPAQLLGQREAQVASSIGQTIANLKTQGWDGPLSEAATSIQSLCALYPEWAQIIEFLDRRYTALNRMGTRVDRQNTIESQLGETGHQILQHLTTMSSAAEILGVGQRLPDDARARFGDIVQRETRALENLSREFFDRLAKLGHSEDLVDVSREMDNLLHLHDAYFPDLELLAEESAATFKRHHSRQTVNVNDAVSWIRRNLSSDIDAVVLNYQKVTSPVLQTAIIHYFEQYLATCLLMPYDAFLKAAVASQYDIDALSEHFQTSYEQVCHRLMTLKKPQNGGIPFAFMKVDAAGNVVKAYSLGDFYIPTQGALCPRWPIYMAGAYQGRTFANRLLHDQGKDFLCISRAIVTKQTSFGRPTAPKALMLVCPWEHADQTVYHDTASSIVMTAGTSCGMCRVPNCPDRLRASQWTLNSPAEVRTF